MGLFEITTIVIALTAVFSYLNRRYVGLPTTIGVMSISLALSLALIVLGDFLPVFRSQATHLVEHIDFNKALLHGMLAFLLFAAALQLELGDLIRQAVPIIVLSVAGTVVSMFLIAAFAWLVLRGCGLPLPLEWCLLFGALISPTDPIAVVGVMMRVGAPAAMQTQMCGESLFNDGVGVVLFTVLLGAARGEALSAPHAVGMFLAQSAGGACIGLITGWTVNFMLQRILDYKVELLLTLALAMGSYSLADQLHVSGPIACVIAGLLVGNIGRRDGMSQSSREILDTFWELLDEVFNAVLFVLIGLEMLTVPLGGKLLAASLLCVPLALLARWLTVGGIIALLKLRRPFLYGTIAVLTWGGLRGGLSVAMALAIPAGPHRSTIVAITYAIVVFSILVQGLTIGRVMRRFQQSPGLGQPADAVSTAAAHSSHGGAEAMAP